LAGEEVEGWVTAEITPYPRPLGGIDAPYEAQFVLAVVEYPSGPLRQWGRMDWGGVEVVLRSERAWQVREEQVTGEMAEAVEELARKALALGWEPAGQGGAWCSLRFRKPCTALRGQLRWR
jgi:hypothetical protein